MLVLCHPGCTVGGCILPARWRWAVVPRHGARGQRGAPLRGGSAGGHGRPGGQSERHRPACGDTQGYLGAFRWSGFCRGSSVNFVQILSVGFVYSTIKKSIDLL